MLYPTMCQYNGVTQTINTLPAIRFAILLLQIWIIITMGCARNYYECKYIVSNAYENMYDSSFM
jgi:hypothetical protein